MIQVIRKDKKDEDKRERRYGVPSFRKVKELFVGSGDSIFRVNKQGLWLGAKKFEDAPFRVSLKGVIEAASFVGTIITAQRLQTSSSGQRVEIDDVSNTIRFYNSLGALVLELQGLTSFTNESQIKMAGGITGTSKTDANYEAGFRIANAGFGATGIAMLMEAFNNETASVKSIASLRTDGEFWHYGTNPNPVVVLQNNGMVQCGGLWPDLPTSDPGNSGELWNDSGTVKVSP